MIGALKRPSAPLIIIFSYGTSVYVVLARSVLSGLSFIFSAEVKDVALLASCLMLHRFVSCAINDLIKIDQINIEIDAKLITKVKEAKSLGVIIDEHLSWSR